MMNIGKCWLIIEESVHEDTKTFVSMISPRRRSNYVKMYLEHIYIDKYASIEEKIAYKKNPNTWAYRADTVSPPYSGIISCGHDPIMMAYFCHKASLNEGILEFAFKTFRGHTEGDRPILNEITNSINPAC